MHHTQISIPFCFLNIVFLFTVESNLSYTVSMQKSLWITTNNYHMTISHMTIWQLPYGRMNPGPPYFPVPLFVLLPTSFQSDWFLVLHVTLLLSTQVPQWPNLNYELWRGRICGWGRLVWRNAETSDFFLDGWWPDHNFEQTFANWLAASQPKSGHCSIWDTCAQEVLPSVLEGCTKPPIGCWPPRASGVLGALLAMSSMTSLCWAVE